MKLAQHMLRDLELQDLRRAFVDAIDARVAEETLGVIFGEIAGAAIDLDAGVDDAAAHFAREHLERRGLAQDILARVGAAGDVLHHAFGRSEERRGGKEWFSPGRSRLSPYH